MNYWSRNDTREWISQLEQRVEDFDYYLRKTQEWCEEYGIDDTKTIFMCNFLTCIWVSNVRDESITFVELMEMLGVDEWEQDEEKFYELGEKWIELDHIELLEQAVESLKDEDF